MLNAFKKKIFHFIKPKRFTEAAAAYNIWADIYDDQPGNLIFYLDEKIISEFLETIDLTNKIVIDVGCGTGRHWKNIFSKNPERLIGYDVSEKMLQKLQEKYPGSKTFLLRDNKLKQTPNAYCDIILSTLVVAHIEDLKNAFAEWDRVLKTGGEIIITDFHPSALENGGTRSFRNKDEMIHIKNHVHTIENIKTIAKILNWQEKNFTEKMIKEDVQYFFKGEDAVKVYHDNYNTPLVYGFLFRKAK